MTRLDDLQRKRIDAEYEITRAGEGLNKVKKHVHTPPVPTPATGALVTIGGRTCAEGDYNTVHRLYKAELHYAKQRLRRINAEILKAQR
jgi:hypothetical protein